MSARAEALLRWAACGAVLCTLLLRAVTTVTSLPGWEQDPTIFWVPDSGLSPFASLALDALVWLAAGIVAVRARAVAWVTGAGVLLGTVGVLLHGFVLTPVIARGGTGMQGHFGSLVLGSAWASALAGAWALREGAREDGALRRTLALVLLGVIVPWGAKGLYQVIVEHPQTVASFERTRDQWLAANGWTPDSAPARLFERRLRQPEASGWFGLANVFGSVAAACAVAWSVIAVNGAALARLRSIRPALALAPSLGALLACVALLASGSKGAIGAAGVVLGLLVMARFAPPVGAVTRRLAPWMGWALVASVLALVLVRGAFGERVGELSVYFRWQYLQGAARVVATHLPFGVGPDGFKDAYLLAKPPSSPEEVESPHMLPADWLATLGLFGVPWLAVWLGWVRGAGREAFRAADREPAPAPPKHPWSRPFSLICVSATVLGSLVAERSVSGPDWPFVMLVAGVAWWMLVRVSGVLLIGAPDRALRIALAGGALSLAMHSMFDVAPVHPHSAAWVMALIALGALSEERRAEPDRRKRRSAVVAGICCWLVAGTTAGFGAVPALRWGGLLSEASRLVRQFPPQAPGTPDPPLSARPGVVEALRLLDAAHRLEPSEPAPIDRAAGLRMRLASEALAVGKGPMAAAHLDGAVSGLAALAETAPRSGARWARLASILAARAALLGDRQALAESLDAWERAASLDPFSLGPALRATEVAVDLGDAERAARWAGRALEIDADLRLDPLRRLSDRQRAALKRAATP